jgi:hypothetical protein
VIFGDNDDRNLFLATLAEGCERSSFQIHSFCLIEAVEAKAQRLVAEALRVSGITQEQLAAWRKGHPFKVRLAAKLRAKTTVTVGWIAQRLGMGTRGHLAHLLYRDPQARSHPPESGQPQLNI